jgi:hypothetical protein
VAQKQVGVPHPSVLRCGFSPFWRGGDSKAVWGGDMATRWFNIDDAEVSYGIKGGRLKFKILLSEKKIEGMLKKLNKNRKKK